MILEDDAVTSSKIEKVNPEKTNDIHYAQYIVLRKDLMDNLNWPRGAAIAQACHASTAALWMYKDEPNTKAYTSDLDNMHKVVLEAKDEEQLRKISKKLETNGILHKVH